MTNTDSLLMSFALGIIMFGIGLNLRFSNFKNVIAAPKAVITGLVGQIVILPLIAILIAWIYPLNSSAQLGILLIAACPGGTSSNLVTYMTKGRVELSVTLTSINSFIILFSIPLIVHFGSSFLMSESKTVEPEAAYIVREIGLTVIIPVLCGMTLNSWKPRTISKIKKPLRYILPGILFAVFAYILIIENQQTEDVAQHLQMIPALVILNISTILTGYFFSKTVGIKHDGRTTIGIEMGLQNSALAIFLARNILEMNEVAVPAVIYGGFSFFTTLALIWVINRVKSK